MLHITCDIDCNVGMHVHVECICYIYQSRSSPKRYYSSRTNKIGDFFCTLMSVCKFVTPQLETGISLNVHVHCISTRLTRTRTCIETQSSWTDVTTRKRTSYTYM